MYPPRKRYAVDLVIKVNMFGFKQSDFYSFSVVFQSFSRRHPLFFLGSYSFSVAQDSCAIRVCGSWEEAPWYQKSLKSGTLEASRTEV